MDRYKLVKKAMMLEDDIEFYKKQIKKIKDEGITHAGQEARLANMYEYLWSKQKQLREITDKLV